MTLMIGEQPERIPLDPSLCLPAAHLAREGGADVSQTWARRNT